MATESSLPTSPPIVAIAAWLIPGSGYLLLGQRGRGLGVGITIITLFLLGMLVAGVRVIEVPGFDVSTGKKFMIPVLVQGRDRQTGALRYYQARDQVTGKPLEQWALAATPLNEIKEKPWSVPQILAGPLAIVAGAASVYAASTDVTAPGGTLGGLSHSRINEIGSLYLSVAGLLNLMAIIDSTWRASQLIEYRSAQKETA